MRPESKPLFSSADRRHADWQSDWTDYFWILVGVVGLVAWRWVGWALGIPLIVLALYWESAKWRERQSEWMDYFCIAVGAVAGLWLWSRGWWMLGIMPIAIALHWGFAKWRERRIKRS